MEISVIGTGYVGLVSGVCFAETGNNVICVDVNAKKVEAMQNGEVPIYEPGLEVLFERNSSQGRLTFTTDLEDAIKKTDIVFLALPTPPGEDGSADLSYVLGVAKQLGPMLNGYKVIVDKSTVPVGTADKVRDAIAENATAEFDVVSNPEFLREGHAVEDFMKPDRVVIGTSSDKARQMMGKLYEPFVRQGNPVIFMDERSAELTKYAANSYLATRISFMNEVANLCELLGADVDMVRKGMGSDSRIGKRFLFPGVGYGGSCFPKDVQALFKTAAENDYDLKILGSVMNVNRKQKSVMVQKVLDHYGGDVNGKHFGVWGLAFKPDTDDIREAPALYIIRELMEQGATFAAFDPEAMDNVKAELGDIITYAPNQYDVLKGADALLIVTEWAVFRNPDLSKVASLLKEKVIFDGRNLYELSDMEQEGFYYNSIGRKILGK